VRDGFREGNALYRTLERFPGQTTWSALELGREVPLEDTGLLVAAFAVPGKLPIHLESARAASPADNVGLRIRDPRSGGVLAYLPAVAADAPGVHDALEGARAVFFDGTFWTSDELIAAKLGQKRAEEMAHWPVGGAGGSLAFLAKLPGRRVLIHLNNTNPLLREDSAECAAARAAGVEVAHDGMELEL